MRTVTRNVSIALLVSLSLLGCSDNSPASTDPASEPKTLIGKAVKQATDEARQELAVRRCDVHEVGGMGDEGPEPSGRPRQAERLGVLG